MNRSLYFWKDQDQSEELCLNANQTLVHMLAAVSVRIWSTWEVLSTDKGKSSSQNFPRASHILSYEYTADVWNTWFITLYLGKPAL